MADEPVPEIVKPVMSLTDRIIDKAVEDTLTTVGQIDLLLELAYKLSPTLPEESPIPMPRGLYDKLKQSGAPWQK